MPSYRSTTIGAAAAVLSLMFAGVAPGEVIISEILDGTLPGGLPKYVELTNCGDMEEDLAGYSIGNFNNGGTALGGGSSTVLSGLLAAGDSYVISYETGDEPGIGTFFDVFGFDPDNFDLGAFINGDDVVALFLADGTGPNGEATGDGTDATMVDVYGVLGVDGSGTDWEYADGYSFRIAGATATTVFDTADWFIAGLNALEEGCGGDDACEELNILAAGTPGVHQCVPIVINEIHADPAADLPGDANGDGTRDSSEDEFVELYNDSGADLDISAWTVSDAVAVRHTFPDGTIIPADCTIVVFGGGFPTGAFGGALVQTASNGFLGFNNGGDTVTVADAGANTIAEVAYGGEGGNNQSLTRDPDITGPFVQHTVALGSGGTLYSPGTLVDGSSFGGCDLPTTGACCLGGGSCMDLTEKECSAAGGSFLGLGSICLGDANGDGTDDACPVVPTGGCCFGDGTCQDITAEACADAGGSYLGDGTVCLGDNDGSGTDDACEPAPAVSINEIRIDQPGGDSDEYFELVGSAGQNLSGLTYLVIGDGAGGSGVIEAVVDLTGSSIPASGHFVAAEASFTLGVADLTTTLDFENSDNVTHMLVFNFSGAEDDDIDIDDDGVPESTPWTEVVDCVAMLEEVGGGDQVYCSTTVGPDGNFVPGHAYRCTPTGDWTIGQFSPDGGDDTPGAVNGACVVTLPADIKPGVCPNPFHTTGNPIAQLWVAVMTDGVFDLSTIDGESLVISRADGVGGAAFAISTETADIATPFEGELCGCHSLNGDGVPDLFVRFTRTEMQAVLELDTPGTELELIISGTTFDGFIVEARDCVTVDPMPEDVNGDGVVNIVDLLALLGEWGECGETCAADIDQDGNVGIADLLMVLAMM